MVRSVYHLQAGARVHSDSWGATLSVYDMRAMTLDSFVFEHPDFLPITVLLPYNYNIIIYKYLVHRRP